MPEIAVFISDKYLPYLFKINIFRFMLTYYLKLFENNISQSHV